MLKQKEMFKKHLHTYWLKRKICLLFVVCLMLPILSLTHVKADIFISSNNFKPDATSVINAYSTEEDVTYTIANSCKLKSISQNDFAYTYYQLSPYGYAVLLDENNSLMEASYSSKTLLPINIEESLLLYYAMPGLFLKKENDGYKDTLHGYAFDAKSISTLSKIENNARITQIEKASSIQNRNISTYGFKDPLDNFVTYEVEPDYFETVDEFGTNVNGTCTVVATAILLGYYDNYVNQQYVHDDYEDSIGTNEAFHQLLNDFIYGDSPQGGIYIRDTVNAINRYLSIVGIRANYQSQNGSPSNIASVIVSKIRQNRPIVASTGTHYGATYDHTVVVYGATYNPDYQIGTAVFHVHTGWHQNTYATWSASWFYELGYISCALNSHGENMYWIPIDDNQHGTVCYCGEHARESHSEYINPSTGICSKCGWNSN